MATSQPFRTGSGEDYRGWMDDLVRIFSPRVRSVLAAEFRRKLSAVGGGGDVYAAAVLHTGGLAWRTAVNTPDFYQEGASHEEDTSSEDVVTAVPAAEEDAHARRLRWSPEEWRSPWARNSPQTTDLFADLEAWISDSTHVEATSWTEVRHVLVDLIVEAMDSDEVRSAFAEAGATPVLLVCETVEADSDTRPVVASLERLNADHPNRADVEEALVYWRDEA